MDVDYTGKNPVLHIICLFLNAFLAELKGMNASNDNLKGAGKALLGWREICRNPRHLWREGCQVCKPIVWNK